jgi:hypothetical protein
MDAFLPRQFSNPESVQAHEFETAREILAQIPGHVMDRASEELLVIALLGNDPSFLSSNSNSTDAVEQPAGIWAGAVTGPTMARVEVVTQGNGAYFRPQHAQGTERPSILEHPG